MNCGRLLLTRLRSYVYHVMNFHFSPWKIETKKRCLCDTLMVVNTSICDTLMVVNTSICGTLMVVNTSICDTLMVVNTSIVCTLNRYEFFRCGRNEVSCELNLIFININKKKNKKFLNF